jgi:hypothetical protein
MGSWITDREEDVRSQEPVRNGLPLRHIKTFVRSDLAGVPLAKFIPVVLAISQNATGRLPTDFCCGGLPDNHWFVGDVDTAGTTPTETLDRLFSGGEAQAVSVGIERCPTSCPAPLWRGDGRRNSSSS